MTISEFNSKYDIEIIKELFLLNRQMAIFYIDNTRNYYNRPINFIEGSLEYFGISEKKQTLKTIISYLDDKSEVCEVRGVEVFINTIKEKLFSSSNEIYFQIPINTDQKRWLAITLQKDKKRGIVMGLIEDVSIKLSENEKLLQTSYKDSLTTLF